MSAAVIAPASAAVEEAHVVLHMALAARWPGRGEARAAVRTAVLGLDDILSACRELPGDTAAEKSAWFAGELIDVMTEHCGAGWGGTP